jgi:hypothetical protein
MAKTTVSPAQVSAVERLIALINADEAGAATQVAEFRAQLADPEDDVDDGDALMWLLKDVIDWDSGFYVDWKDTESFVDSIDTLCVPWNVAVDWGVDDPEDDDFLDGNDVPGLMQLAQASLASQGFTLWNWATDGDCYSGWITRSTNDAEIHAISDRLQVEFRPGSSPF